MFKDFLLYNIYFMYNHFFSLIKVTRMEQHHRQCLERIEYDFPR